jgi:hypothetical protein
MGRNRLFLGRSQARLAKENRLAVEEIPRPTRRCVATGRPLQPGEQYRTELRFTETGWDRRDFSLESSPERSEESTAWWEAELPPGPPTKLPPRELDARLLSLVERWGTSLSAAEGERRYAAVMLLAGRKALKLQEIVRDADRDFLVFAQGRGKPPIQVADPGLNDEELKRRQTEVVELAQNAL